MSPSLIATSFLVHGVLSASCGAAVGFLAKGVEAETKALGLCAVSLMGQALVFVAFGKLGDRVATTASLPGALLLAGTACFGLTDFPQQALLRGKVGRAFEGSPLLEDAMANVIFCLTAGNIAFFAAGPAVPPARQASACVLLGLVSAAGLLASRGAPGPDAPPAAVAVPTDAKV